MSDSLWSHGLYVACQAPLSMGFSRKEYWSGLPFHAPRDLPDPGIKPCPLCLPHWQVGSLPPGPSGKPATSYYMAIIKWFFCIRISSVTQSCPTLCYPMDYSMPGFPVHHQLPELAQTHIHWVGDAIQSSHPLSSLSPPAFSLSQHQGLF